jgi:hypothetical protein
MAGEQHDNCYVIFKVLKTVTIPIMFFWVKSPCKLIGRSQRFGKRFIHLQGQSDDFSPEDGDSTLLRNFGFYQPVYTVT